ncbi:MAG TPA: hypothetical protein VHG93_22190 [Longimicrobium sp.]|nr:hypothetical protein [Longimicrobium sp.]
MPKAHTLVENFNDDTPNTSLWYPYGGAETEVNGRLEIRPRSSFNDTYGGYTSVATYDLTGSSVCMEVVHAGRMSAGMEVYLGVVKDASNAATMGVGNSTIFCSRRVAGTQTTPVSLPYDPAAHRWLRLREQTGTLFYETSPDGTTWAQVCAIPAPFALTAVQVDIAGGAYDPVASPGVLVIDNVNTPDAGLPRHVQERRLSAAGIRERAAEVAAARRHEEHVNNNDEVNYPTRLLAGNYSKGLAHDSLGDPDPGSYSTLLRALQSEDPQDFEEIILGTIPAGARRFKLINPQAGYAFDLEGPDAQALTIPPAPRFDSEQTAAEAGELYWMAVLRDLPFQSYGTDGTAAVAINSLNTEFPRFGGTAPVTAQNLFRGIFPGEQVGPYVSQFLLRGNVDPRKPAGQGRDAVDGFISYGSRTIDQRLFPASANADYLTAFATWLEAQNGVDKRGGDTFDTTKRFIWNLRAGATFVHFDQVVDAFYNAAWILMSEPTGDQKLAGNATGRPQIDQEFPNDQGNPYDPPGTASDSRTQSPFATFGPPHLLQALVEVLGRALQAVWWQKWGVHRRLRPEEYGGRVHNHVTGARTYPLHTSITTSLQGGLLAPYFGNSGEKFPASYLLPQAFAEGAPTHPAYGAGHATGAGACATILKAFFDETKSIENPLQASTDGLTLVAYTGADASQMTVGGELNKLAGNIALFRNAAGVHWRTDYTESLPLGEAIAIGLLQEMSLGFSEDDAFFELTKFDGQRIRIFDGKVVPA